MSFRLFRPFRHWSGAHVSLSITPRALNGPVRDQGPLSDVMCHSVHEERGRGKRWGHCAAELDLRGAFNSNRPVTQPQSNGYTRQIERKGDKGRQTDRDRDVCSCVSVRRAEEELQGLISPLGFNLSDSLKTCDSDASHPTIITHINTHVSCSHTRTHTQILLTYVHFCSNVWGSVRFF